MQLRSPAHRSDFPGLMSLTRSLAIALAVALGASAADADEVSVILSFPSAPVTPVGAITIEIGYDPLEMTPLPAGQPEVRTVGKVPDLWISTNEVEGTVEVTGLSALGIGVATDLAAVAFDQIDLGEAPTLAVNVTEAGDTMPFPMEDWPEVAYRIEMPEPMGAAGAVSAIAALATLGRRRRRSRS